MYIPTILSRAFATPFDVPSSTSTAQELVSGHAILVARRVGHLGGRAPYAMGSGIAIGLIGMFVLGALARCIIRERKSQREAKAHVQALAIQDREYWGVDTTSTRRIRREAEEDIEEERETESGRRIRQRQEEREMAHGKFDSILERLEKRTLQENGIGECGKGGKNSEDGKRVSLSEKETSGGLRDSGSESEDSGVRLVAKPEPVYKGGGVKSSGGNMSLPSLRTGIS